MKWRNHAALLEIGASPREVDATPSHSLSVSSSCFPLLINKMIFFHLSTTLYPTDRLTSSASSASSRFLSLARVGPYFEVSTKNPRLTNRAAAAPANNRIGDENSSVTPGTPGGLQGRRIVYLAPEGVAPRISLRIYWLLRHVLPPRSL